jgi:AcrR family transcriptional regulator
MATKTVATTGPKAHDKPVAKGSIRQSAEERREQVLEAATHEFAQRGYHAASTASIAEGAGISQPYIYALFPNKRELFLAAQARMVSHLRSAFVNAALGLDTPEERLKAMGLAYRPLVEANPDELLLQMQGHAAAGDPEIGPAVAASFKALYDDVARVSGASPAEVANFFACGMLINVATALGLPEIVAPALEWDADATELKAPVG